MKWLLWGMVVLASAGGAQASDLYGIDRDSGQLYSISTVDASLALVGNTYVSGFGSLEFAPDGRLFGITTGDSPLLYQINPNTAAATPVGPLNIGFVFEGGLAFSPNGTAYAVNQDGASSPRLFEVNLATGQATVIGVISGGSHDINGLGWRSDGRLVGLDRVSNSLLTIDPATAISSPIGHLTPVVGGVGGMAVISDSGYFNTSGPGGSISGSNELYSFNAFTGEYHLVGSFSPFITGSGIGGLAMIPEPSTTLLGAVGAFSLALSRRLRKRSASLL